jgi:hypothetical protein
MMQTDSRLCKYAKSLKTLQQDIYSLLVSIKKNEDWPRLTQEFRKNGEDGAWIDVTIGCTFDHGNSEVSWNYQTGDNSFTGGAYGHPEWFTTTVCSRSNCRQLAADLISEVENRICELADIGYMKDVAKFCNLQSCGK